MFLVSHTLTLPAFRRAVPLIDANPVPPVTGGSVPPEQVVSNGQVVFNSGTMTLPPVSLSDVMSLAPSSETDPEVS